MIHASSFLSVTEKLYLLCQIKRDVLNSNSNSMLAIFLIIGSLVCAALVNVHNALDINAQGANNQSLNTSGAAVAQNMTLDEDSVTPDLSNFTAESGTVTAEGTSCRELLACVKVYSYCNISSPPSFTNNVSISCAPIVSELFRIYPYIYQNNMLIPVGRNEGIEADSSGKIITFPVKANTSITYVIQQDLSPFDSKTGSLFHIFQSGSGCKGEIKAGETKDCRIYSDLYVKTRAGY